MLIMQKSEALSGPVGGLCFLFPGLRENSSILTVVLSINPKVTESLATGLGFPNPAQIKNKSSSFLAYFFLFISLEAAWE